MTKIDDTDVNKTLVSKEQPYGAKNSFKYFIGYNDNVIRPLCIMLPQMTSYTRKFDDNTTMSFTISNIQLLKKYNQIWKKVKGLLKIKFDSEPVYSDNDKDIKTKLKTYGASVIANYQDKKYQKKKHHASVYQ